MTPQQIETMKLALEALEADELDMVDDGSGNMVFRKEQAITALEEALAEHAMRNVQRLGQEIEQEPVAWITPDGEGFRIRFSPPTSEVPLKWDALYTTPPHRKPLTDDELSDIWFKQSTDWMEFARAIEAAHGIKEDT